MKLNLRKKIILYSLITNFIIASLIGGTLYKYAGEQYYQAFISGKEALARAIALSIDGDKHSTFTDMSSKTNSEYRKYLKYLNNIRVNEKHVSYLFTINYDRKNDRLTYIVDSDIAPGDLIWITTEFFGFALTVSSDNKISIKYNEVVYDKDFEVNIKGKKYPLIFGEDGTLSIGGKKLVKIVSKAPLQLETSGKILNLKNRELYSEIVIDDSPAELYCSFIAKGESQSLPGEFYAESKEVIQNCKDIINSRKSAVIEREHQTSIYGLNTATVYGIISDNKGVANGLVVIELFKREVENFKRSVFLISLFISLVTFVVTLILTFLLAEYIIIPIRQLTRGTEKVSAGNLDCKINMKRNDEFGRLASSFNSMVSNIKNAHIEITSANEELNNYKNNLEILVEKRTKELTKSNVELNNALSEVKALKGLLPIYASCKKIRDDNGYWSQIESYISSHSQAEFTHSICPSCAKRLYPDFYKNLAD